MKNIKKIIQNAFKFTFYKIFSLFHGKIKGKINSDNDSRIKVETVKKDNNLQYKIFKITNGRLYTDRIHDAAILVDNFVVEGPSFQLRRENNVKGNENNAQVEENIVFQKGTPRIKNFLNGSVLSLLTGGAGNDNYFHWLYDVLPRFSLFEKISDLNKVDFFLLPSTEKKFQKESLDLLNISRSKIISSKFFRHINCPELFITEHPYVVTDNASIDIQNIPIWISRWLKDKYVKIEPRNNLDFPKKIYIDRGDSASNTKDLRMIINENEVKNFLTNRGFKAIKLGNFHFKDQVKIFNNAEIVVGLHGGGFANLCFCKKGTKVVELQNTIYGKVIGNLAKANELIYKSVNCEFSKYKGYNQFGHINVSINLLKETIESLN